MSGYNLKTNYLLVATATMLFALVGCDETTDPIDEEPNPTGHATVRSDLTRDTSPNVPDADMQALIEGNHAFTLDMYSELLEEDGNIMGRGPLVAV